MSSLGASRDMSGSQQVGSLLQSLSNNATKLAAADSAAARAKDMADVIRGAKELSTQQKSQLVGKVMTTAASSYSPDAGTSDSPIAAAGGGGGGGSGGEEGQSEAAPLLEGGNDLSPTQTVADWTHNDIYALLGHSDWAKRHRMPRGEANRIGVQNLYSRTGGSPLRNCREQQVTFNAIFIFDDKALSPRPNQGPYPAGQKFNATVEVTLEFTTRENGRDRVVASAHYSDPEATYDGHAKPLNTSFGTAVKVNTEGKAGTLKVLLKLVDHSSDVVVSYSDSIWVGTECP